MLTHISVRGAREHNLKGVDDRHPARHADVITGLSGSGKSSLAFDTIYAEGQRRYVESLSAYARQFLELMQKPDVDHIEGLSPRHLDRAEDHQPQPALDRRDRHRDLRLYAPALGARRHPLFARHRPADRRADRQPDGRPRHGAARGHAPLPARPGRARPQGRVSQGTGRVAEGRLHPRPHRRRVLRDRGRPGARQEVQARHRSGGRPPRRSRAGIETRLADSFETALKLAEGLAYVDLVDATVAEPLPSSRDRRRRSGAEAKTKRAAARLPHPDPPRRGRTGGSDEGRRHPRQPHRLLRKIRLPGLRLHHRRDRAAAVLVQRPAGRLPGLRRPRREAAVRSAGPRRPQRRAQHQEGRGRALGQVQPAVALITCRCSAASRANSASASTRRGRTCPARCSDHPPRHRRQAGHAHLHRRPQEL